MVDFVEHGAPGFPGSLLPLIFYIYFIRFRPTSDQRYAFVGHIVRPFGGLTRDFAEQIRRTLFLRVAAAGLEVVAAPGADDFEDGQQRLSVGRDGVVDAGREGGRLVAEQDAVPH